MAKQDNQKILDQARILTRWVVPDDTWKHACEVLINAEKIYGNVITTSDGLPSESLMRTVLHQLIDESKNIESFLGQAKSTDSKRHSKRGVYHKCLLNRLAVCEFVERFSTYTPAGIRRPWGKILPAWNKAHAESDAFGSVESMKRQVISWWGEFESYTYISLLNTCSDLHKELYYLTGHAIEDNIPLDEATELKASELTIKIQRIEARMLHCEKIYGSKLKTLSSAIGWNIRHGENVASIREKE